MTEKPGGPQPWVCKELDTTEGQNNNSYQTGRLWRQLWRLQLLESRPLAPLQHLARLVLLLGRLAPALPGLLLPQHRFWLPWRRQLPELLLRLRCQESPQGQPQMWECLQLPLRLWPRIWLLWLLL